MACNLWDKYTAFCAVMGDFVDCCADISKCERDKTQEQRQAQREARQDCLEDVAREMGFTASSKKVRNQMERDS